MAFSIRTQMAQTLAGQPGRLWPILAALAGSTFLTGLYFGIVSWAESPQHALDLFWQQRWLIAPLILGFGIQTGLYTVLRLRLFLPPLQAEIRGAHHVQSSGAVTGAGGATSTAAMVACCAHHVTDVLPVLGLSAAATFLAQYQTEFMVFGLAATLAGIGFMLAVLFRERRKVLAHAAQCGVTLTD